MAKKKKKNPAADKLIDSLMEDLNLPQQESTKTSHEETSTSIARSADLIRDLEDQIASQALSEAQAQKAVMSLEVPEDEEDIVSSLDEAEFSVPMEPQVEGSIRLETPEVPQTNYGSSFDPDKILFEGSNNREDVGLPSVSGIFSSAPVRSDEDQTVSIQQDRYTGVSAVSSVTGLTTDAEKTVAVEGFAQARKSSHKKSDVDVKVSIGGFRGGRTGGNVMTSVDASLAQAENLRLAQQRILALEKEVESLRAENEELASAADIIRTRSDEMAAQLTRQEHEKADIQESYQGELMLLKGSLQHKDAEMIKARQKVEDLETRLKSDFKKIRVRERELENRLELLRAEKIALVRSKDEYILDLKRKIDQASTELDNYRKKVLELNRTIDANQEQVKRTERALRLALNNLEAQEENVVPLKKAE